MAKTDIFAGWWFRIFNLLSILPVLIIPIHWYLSGRLKTPTKCCLT
jgi:hypothetical protein